MKLKFTSLSLYLLLAACSHWPLQRSLEGAASTTLTSEENEINNADRLMSLGRYEESRIQFRSFQEAHPTSRYLQSARLGEAQALEGLGRWNEAVAIDRDVFLKTEKLQPTIAALALYRMSFAYEALGNDQKTIAALLDAKKMGADARTELPVEVIKAEIPARLAANYARLGQDSEAGKYLAQAEKGLEEVQQEKRELNPSWLAKTYVQMGSTSLNQLSKDNYEQSLEGQKIVQVYLLKALKLNESMWSKQALEHLQGNFQTFLSYVEMTSTNRSTQVEMAGGLNDLIEQAELYKPLADKAGTPMETEYEKSFYSYLSTVKKRVEDILYQSKETMPLTEESQKFHSLKWPFKSPQKNEKKPLPSAPDKNTPIKIVPTEDPNL